MIKIRTKMCFRANFKEVRVHFKKTLVRVLTERIGELKIVTESISIYIRGDGVFILQVDLQEKISCLVRNSS